MKGSYFLLGSVLLFLASQTKPGCDLETEKKRGGVRRAGGRGVKKSKTSAVPSKAALAQPPPAGVAVLSQGVSGASIPAGRLSGGKLLLNQSQS